MPRTVSYRLVLAAALPLATGCMGLKQTLRQTVRLHQKPPVGQVNRLLVLWSDAVLRQDEEPVARGFVCKLYLMGPDSRQPVTAPGQITFYAFPEQPSGGQEQPDWDRPARQWRFTADQMAARLERDLIGWGYKFWLPFGPPEPTEQQYSLVCRFTPAGGQPLLSEFTIVPLHAVARRSDTSYTKRR